MYYLLVLLLLAMLAYAITHVVSSLVKGLLSLFFVVVIVYMAVILVRSTKAPVDLFGMYRVDNFEIEKIK